MRTLSIEEFKNLVASSDWTHTVNLEVIDGHGRLNAPTEFFGIGQVVSTLDDMKIIYNESFRYTEGNSNEFEIGGVIKPFNFHGFQVIVRNPQEGTLERLSELLPSVFSKIDYIEFKASI